MTGEWYNYNDSFVDLIKDPTQFVNKSINIHPYILFYTRTSSKNKVANITTNSILQMDTSFQSFITNNISMHSQVSSNTIPMSTTVASLSQIARNRLHSYLFSSPENPSSNFTKNSNDTFPEQSLKHIQSNFLDNDEFNWPVTKIEAYDKLLLTDQSNTNGN